MALFEKSKAELAKTLGGEAAKVENLQDQVSKLKKLFLEEQNERNNIKQLVTLQRKEIKAL